MGQEKDFYDLDNSYHEIYCKSKVKLLKVYTKEYNNGELKEKYLELTHKFDTDGNIIEEREYFNSDTIKGWKVNCFYNQNHQLIKTIWTWLDENDTDITEYEYDLDNKLIRSCDYFKGSKDSELKLEECLNYHYIRNRIIKVTTDDDEVDFYYKKKGATIFGYTSNNKLKYKYRKGEFIYQNLDSIIFHYKRNRIGQILEITKTDDKKNVKSRSVYKYSNGLLEQIISKDDKGSLIREEDYIYEYYE